MLRGGILFPPGMEDASSDDGVHQSSNGWWCPPSWVLGPTPALQITRLVSKRNSNTKSLRLTAKTPFSSSCHLHSPFPDHSQPSSPLSESPAHTTTPQNTGSVGGSLTPVGVKILWHPLAQQILFLSAGSSALPDPSLPSCPPKPTMLSIFVPVQISGSQQLCCVIKITPFCHPGPKHLSGALVKGLNTRGLRWGKKLSPRSWAEEADNHLVITNYFSQGPFMR